MKKNLKPFLISLTQVNILFAQCSGLEFSLPAHSSGFQTHRLPQCGLGRRSSLGSSVGLGSTWEKEYLGVWGREEQKEEAGDWNRLLSRVLLAPTLATLDLSPCVCRLIIGIHSVCCPCLLIKT